MKKLFLIIATLALFLTGCGTGNDGKQDAAQQGEGKAKRIALVLPEKIGVNPFFILEDEGGKKAAQDFGVEVKTIESTDPAVIEQNLRSAVADGYDLIITSSFESEDALKKVAAENPEQKFAIIDTVVDLPNVRSVVFREYEASYLLGAAAGLSTKTNTVGLVVAMDIPLMKKFTGGFEQGLKAVNPNAKLLIHYVGSFTDPAKAKELALLQHSQGADFIAGMSAVGDLGVFEAAKEKGFYTSGQDVDRTELDPEHIVLSQLKGADTAVYETIKDFVEGNFKPGVIDYGLKENGVGLTFVTHESKSPLSPFIGEENIAKLKEIKDEIVSGKRTVKNPLEP